MENKIAVIGISCQFPGARNQEEYWENLIQEKETLKHFTNEELEDFELDFDKLKDNPAFVKTNGMLADIDKFDISFFGMTPKEASETDPQQRLWLKNAWNALEDAGCDPFSYNGAIGVFAGGSTSSYLYNNILRDPAKFEDYLKLRSTESYQIMTGNETSYIPTKTAYKFNLRGPAVNIQTACSTSLVAIIQACNSLFSYESDMCIAGGVSITIPQETGYLYEEGGILSPDGHCRPFDMQAKGTVPGCGVGVVVLKRLEDALKDGDRVYALVSGWGINNDGNKKVSYTAPSVDGQAEAIMMAQSFAEVSPADISYIETHGTGTHLGDPIEVAALTKAFSAKTNQKQFCGIGSVKSNIGHTDAAAGAAGFIKTSLAAFHKIIPATLHFTQPNPQIDFENSPFFVQNELRIYQDAKPLIMGVSSFGIGGTNAHLIVEEPPQPEKSVYPKTEWPALLLVSAKSAYSIEERKNDLIKFLQKKPQVNLHEVAYSLACGRNHMTYRSFIAAHTIQDITDTKNSFTDLKKDPLISKTAFMFPGQGAQYIGMGQELYRNNVLFHNLLDECFAIFKTETGQDLKEIIFQDPSSLANPERLADTEITQPALFIIEYAVARMMLELGITPACLIGHSIGEYTAACLAGVFDMKTALRIVIMRGKLMQKMPLGEMMVAKAGKSQLESLKSNLFEIAADNASEFCTISLKPAHLTAVKTLLDSQNIGYIPLKTSHAFHSSDFDPILQTFEDYVNQFSLKKPELPFISCLTGDFITEEQAISGKYWAQQLRNTVRFREGIRSILNKETVAFLEVGPNTHLSPLVRQNEKLINKKSVFTTLGKADNIEESIKMINAVGNLFAIGIQIDIEPLQPGGRFHKISLPVYPFENKSYWITHDVKKARKNQIAYEPAQLTDYPPTDPSNADVDHSLGITDPTQLEILRIWQGMFGIEKISPEDDFYELGGHSLLALQINNRIKDLFKIELSLKDVLENPTISKLSKLVNQIKPVEQISLEHHVQNTNLPLTNNQKRLWLIAKMDPNTASYIISDTYKFSGPLRIDLLQKSLEKLFERHITSYSSFKEIDGEPFLDIVPRPIHIQLHDFSDFAASEQQIKLDQVLKNDSSTPFDLGNELLFRFHLIKFSPEEYIFHLSIHHIIFDGWSWAVFAYDLSEYYNSLVKGVPEKLEPIEFQQFDYAFWEQSSHFAKKEEASKAFWTENLKGSSQVLNFPYDAPRKENPTGTGRVMNLAFNREISDQLRTISNQEGVSLFNTLFAVYGLLLHKYTGADDLNIGVPIAFRPHSKLENIFGMFVNTIVIRLKFERGLTFQKLLQQVKNATLDAIDHQDLAFDKVVEIVNPERIANVNPLFQVAFAWQNNLEEPLNLTGLKITSVEEKDRFTEFDVCLSLWENEGIIEGNIEYDTDILQHETMQRVTDHYLQLAENVISHQQKALESIPLVTEKDLKLIESFNLTQTAYPREKTLSQLFEEQAERYPDRKAVIFQQASMTYKELNEKANQLAHKLRTMGVQANSLVGIVTDKSLQMIVGIWGILKAGGAYVPIAPEYPAERLNFIFSDSGCNLLLAQEKYMPMPLQGVIKLNLDDQSSYHPDHSNPAGINQPTDLAYIIYTSGTTGTPKGSLIPQRGVIRLVCNTNYIEYTSQDVVSQASAIVFDASTEEIFGALLNGASLVLIDKETLLDAALFGKVLADHQVTIVDLTSALFTQIAEARVDIFTGVKKLILGGDVVSAAHVNKLKRCNPGIEVINTYGPTENSCNSTAYSIQKEFESNIPIGKPISNSTAYIFDKYMNYQPIGVIGELFVGGDGVSLGYLNRPELNKTAFIEHPYQPGERLYKTGDLAKWLPDGNIEFHGRADNQIKIRGYRVELEEIESVISEMEGIVETVVKPIKVEDGDYKLVAFLHIQDSFGKDTTEISRILKAKLPPYMVPSSFKLLLEFPKTINGKIDRKALTIEEDELHSKNRTESKPLSDTESRLLAIWKKVLNTSDILTSDNFFDIGGNSLMTISLASKIEKEFGVEFSIRTFFGSPNIKELALLLDLKRNEKQKPFAPQSDSFIIEGEI